MKKIILSLFILVFILNSLSANYYNINLSQNETELFLENINVELGEIEEEQIFYGDSLLRIFSFENEILYERKFETFGYLIREGDLGKGYFESEILYYNFTEINLQAPYYSNAKEIVIYDEELNEKLRIDVSLYSKIEEGTSLKEGEVEKERTDRKDEDSQKELEDYWWILLIILIILIFIFVISLRKKKPKKTIQ